MEITRELLSEIAQEAHTMGRIYSRGGEVANPADEFRRIETMIGSKLKSNGTPVKILIVGDDRQERIAKLLSKLQELDGVEIVPQPTAMLSDRAQVTADALSRLEWCDNEDVLSGKSECEYLGVEESCTLKGVKCEEIQRLR